MRNGVDGEGGKGAAVVRRVLRLEDGARREELLRREWLVANGLGGYASSTVGGACSRRYHGLLIAACRAPLGRVVAFSELEETALPPGGGGAVELGGRRAGAPALRGFRLESGLPVWDFEAGGRVVEKRVLLPHRQNTVYVRYRLVSGAGPLRLELRPWLHLRPLDESVDRELPGPYAVQAVGPRYELKGEERLPALRLFLEGAGSAFHLTGGEVREVEYPVEAQRGYPGRERLWCPGVFQVELAGEGSAILAASTEPWEVVDALHPEEVFRTEMERRQRLLADAHPSARAGTGGELVLAADQFIIAPVTRAADEVRAHAAGDEIRSVIAGFHWFTDWGRDTMITLEGLTLATGRFQEAAYILRTFARSIRDGLIPNLFPEGSEEGLYHTADATLWFFHAVDRYLQSHRRPDHAAASSCRSLAEIVRHHVRGTRFGIGIDPADGLLRQGAAGLPADLDGRQGGRLGGHPAARQGGGDQRAVVQRPAAAGGLAAGGGGGGERPPRRVPWPTGSTRSFNRRFWNGRDRLPVRRRRRGGRRRPGRAPQPAVLLLPPPPGARSRRWEPVLRVVRERLLTPYGLRTLAPGEPGYQPHYGGDLRARDAAYHQGTVWPWLIGPFVDAWLRVHPGDRERARGFLRGVLSTMDEYCIGQIAEVFDADPPRRPGGCAAQAWSVAETLRAWALTAPAAAAAPDG